MNQLLTGLQDLSSGGTVPKCQVAILASPVLPAFAEPQYAELTAQDILRSHGNMLAYRRLMDDGGPRLHAGVAEFSTPAAGMAAVEALNGRTLEVSFDIPSQSGSQRKVC